MERETVSTRVLFLKEDFHPGPSSSWPSQMFEPRLQRSVTSAAGLSMTITHMVAGYKFPEVSHRDLSGTQNAQLTTGEAPFTSTK